MNWPDAISFMFGATCITFIIGLIVILSYKSHNILKKLFAPCMKTDVNLKEQSIKLDIDTKNEQKAIDNNSHIK